ncbi:MAG: hypothetical protein KDH15_09105 [Rhodocyclaceae bacterium]|nr:hypothetical protein [Rhodocyclaceae bacterium]
MSKNKILGFAAAATLIAVLIVLVALTRSVDLEAHNRIVATLREMKQLDAEWNTEVLRSKTGFSEHYDAVARPLAQLASLESRLEQQTAGLIGREGGDAVALALQSYREVIKKKIDAVEHFKSQNAILRNSSRYLPTAAQELGDGITAAGVLPAEKIVPLLADLVNRSLSYILAPEQSRRELIEGQLAQLGRLPASLPAELAEKARLFASHVETVLRQQDAGDVILGELDVLPTAERIDVLSDAIAGQHDRSLLAQQQARQWLIAYSVALLLALAWLASRLIRSFRLLRRSNASLQKAHAELQESQVYMVQSEKMSALGQMVAGIAHEINTPLAYVKGTVDVMHEQIAGLTALLGSSRRFAWLMRQQADKSDIRDEFVKLEALAKKTVDDAVLEEMDALLESSSNGISQISEIVVNLKNFSRLDRAKVSQFDVREGLESTLLLAKNLLKNKVRIDKEFDDIPNISCSPSQINQVFLNLITNAAQAIPDDREGVLTLRTSRAGTDRVRVEIQDNGAGIPADVLPKIFDPFFTTKEVGKGTGMGLSISYKIIQTHAGRIEVDTEAEVGTVFTIELPVQPPVVDDDAMLIDDEMPLAA